MTLRQKGKINKKMIAAGIAVIATILLVIVTIGSTTLQRRKHLQNVEKDIVEENDQIAHLTGDLLEIRAKIEQGTLEEGYMSKEEQQSILELYEIANQWKVKNNDQRMQELIYNALLVKNQKNPIYILLGNGYVCNFRELILEMEIPAFLFNFGVIGFILYFMPFACITGYGIYFAIKNRKQIDTQYLMYLGGCGFTFALSFFAGYTFFNSSNMIIIIVLNTLLINKITHIQKEERGKKS